MKFYVHHIYSYELFWYFFHGVDIDPKTIPTWFYENRHNKNIKIDFDVHIEFQYKNIKCTAIFCDDRNWNLDDGDHLFDYNLDLLQRNIIADRGWNSVMDLKLNEYVLFLNEKSKNLKNNKIKFFYINWEPFAKNELFNFRKLNKNIEVYADISVKDIHSDSIYYSFSHFLASFIWPNTIHLREFFFMADYLKTFNQYECKINYPIRKITKFKFDLFNNIQKLNNTDIRCTLSSFTDYKQHEKNKSIIKEKLNNSIKNGINVKYIQKRGYNLDDWGGEWNDSNMKEFMYKLLSYSHINIVGEPTTHVTEKSILHILAGKPFIPQYYKTIDFFTNEFSKYGLVCEKYPLKYSEIQHFFDILVDIVNDKNTFNYILNELQIWVDSLRNNFIEVIHNHNDMLDISLLGKSDDKSVL